MTKLPAQAIKKRHSANRRENLGKGRISLAPLDLETALRAAIATGPIMDEKIKKRRKRKP
jgi:hypothetical protein